ncbi:MAG: hypothetical protein DSY42_02505 [Aquifex sp.]|nr:MAG: hypothetical protein DSY42_02505 [Aquifex sp.]
MEYQLRIVCDEPDVAIPKRFSDPSVLYSVVDGYVIVEPSRCRLELKFPKEAEWPLDQVIVARVIYTLGFGGHVVATRSGIYISTPVPDSSGRQN